MLLVTVNATTSATPLRRDAERNRERILDAARELFAARGLAVTLDDVARHAGVGVGTVYRRFANREALIDALFDDKLAKILETARAASAHPDQWDGFVLWITGVCELFAAEHINIDYCYASSGGRNGQVFGIFKVSNTDRAKQLLSGGGANHKRSERRPLRDKRSYSGPPR